MFFPEMVGIKVNSMNEANYDTLGWLPENAPYVEVDPEKIKIIESPTDFYNKLLVGCLLTRPRLLIFVLNSL